MRRTMLTLLILTATWIAIGPNIVHADGMALPLPDATSTGYLVVRSHHVSVRIEDDYAVTSVEQEFHNPYGWPVTARYLFPLPPEAIVTSFEATVGGLPQAAIHQDATATNSALYATISDQHDPSLLQYAGWESLAFDLHLPPGGSQRMHLEYGEVLVPSGGLYRYRYVLSTERYSSAPLDAVSVNVELHDTSSLASVYSPSHPVSTEQLGSGRVAVHWESRNTNPDQDFELFFAPAQAGLGGGLLTGQRQNADHFLLLLSPELEPADEDTVSKDIVFVLDRSGSMSGEKIEQARAALHHILEQLAEGDRFSIVSFNDQVSSLAAELQPVGPRTIEAAQQYVGELWADSGTDLESALQRGLEILARSEHRNTLPLVIFLTDGLPTAGITDEANIARLVTESNARIEARLHVFGVGYDVNTHLLDGLAAENGGSVTYVQPGENLEVALTGFYAKIAQPVLTDLEIEFEGMTVSDLLPQQVPDLFHGSTLLLTGRYGAAGDRATVRVRGWAGGEQREFVYHFDLPQAGGHDFVPRLWATRQVGVLLDQIRTHGEEAFLVEEIQTLGLTYGIVTPYTSFVIEGQAEGAASVENMILYQRSGLNQATGETTIRARVQNQMYQQAEQASLAIGANVTNFGPHSLAQVGVQQIDLSLLQNRHDPGQPVTGDWIARNLDIDRTVVFGSEEYFALAADPEARPFLQSGTNVVFAYGGQTIAVSDANDQPVETESPGASDPGLSRSYVAQPEPLPQSVSDPAPAALARDLLSFWLPVVALGAALLSLALAAWAILLGLLSGS